jgi:hypothetical protein
MKKSPNSGGFLWSCRKDRVTARNGREREFLKRNPNSYYTLWCAERKTVAILSWNRTPSLRERERERAETAAMLNWNETLTFADHFRALNQNFPIRNPSLDGKFRACIKKERRNCCDITTEIRTLILTERCMLPLNDWHWTTLQDFSRANQENEAQLVSEKENSNLL